MKVIFFGLPMRLCQNSECSQLFGFWSFAADWLPLVSEDEYGEPVWKFMSYEGAYLSALWHWLVEGA
jgi:hypothetical protein